MSDDEERMALLEQEGMTFHCDEIQQAVRRLRFKVCDWYTYEENRVLCDEDEEFHINSGEQICWTCERILDVFVRGGSGGER